MSAGQRFGRLPSGQYDAPRSVAPGVSRVVLNFHHIFPKAVLRKANYEKSEINEIANMAFITGQTNRRLATKTPGDYFPKIIEQHSEGALASQAIPLDRELWKVESYRKFLEARRAELARIMNGHLLRVREA